MGFPEGLEGAEEWGEVGGDLENWENRHGQGESTQKQERQSCPSGAPRAVHEERPFVPGPGGHSIEIVCLMNFPLAAIAVTTTKSTLDENGQAT